MIHANTHLPSSSPPSPPPPTPLPDSCMTPGTFHKQTFHFVTGQSEYQRAVSSGLVQPVSGFFARPEARLDPSTTIQDYIAEVHLGADYISAGTGRSRAENQKLPQTQLSSQKPEMVRQRERIQRVAGLAGSVTQKAAQSRLRQQQLAMFGPLGADV